MRPSDKEIALIVITSAIAGLVQWYLLKKAGAKV
jgi:hypothetical protein